MKNTIYDPLARSVNERFVTTETGIKLGCAHVRTEREASAISGPWNRDTMGDKAARWATVAGLVFVAGLLIWEAVA